MPRSRPTTWLSSTSTGADGRRAAQSVIRHADPSTAVPRLRGRRRRRPHALVARDRLRPGRPADPDLRHDARGLFQRRGAGHPQDDAGGNRLGLRMGDGRRDRRAVSGLRSGRLSRRPRQSPRPVHLGADRRQGGGDGRRGRMHRAYGADVVAARAGPRTDRARSCWRSTSSASTAPAPITGRPALRVARAKRAARRSPAACSAQRDRHAAEVEREHEADLAAAKAQHHALGDSKAAPPTGRRRPTSRPRPPNRCPRCRPGYADGRRFQRDRCRRRRSSRRR